MFPHPPLTAALLGIAAALALPGAALGQTATRTWISHGGADANACTRSSPCKTLAGALAKTAAKGEITALDNGVLGPVTGPLTITKSITIDVRAARGSVHVSGDVNAIVVNAATTDRVVLKGLDVNGSAGGRNGVRILQARSVKIVDSDIYGFAHNGVDVEHTSSLVRVVVLDSRIHDNVGNGVAVAPVGTSLARVTLRRNDIDDNGCGVVATRFGMSDTFSFFDSCGTAGPGSPHGATSVVNMFGNSISDSDRHGVFASGGSATVRLSRNSITGSNSAVALRPVDGGQILTYANNFVTGNPGGNGATTGAAIAPMR